uniref:Anoctamin n=1 Tax=Heligmosomoides polygyrus TaxID=6339 RepID=A0A8L8Q323_HELPZ
LAFEMDKQCYFSDGKRQIDFVLAYEENASSDLNEETPTLLDIDLDDEDDEPDSTMTPRSAAEKKRRKRSLFELNLERMGLQLERVKIAPTVGYEFCSWLLGCTRFVLIHAPFSVLERQAQLLAVKLPVQQSDLQFKYGSMLPGFVDRILAEFGLFDFDAQLKKHLEEPVFFQAPYATDRRQQFINWDRPDILFPNAERSRMVYDLLTRARYDEVILDRSMRTTTQYTFGIERLLAQRVYNAAYPLHQDSCTIHKHPAVMVCLQTRREGNTRGVEISQRELLYNHWVSWRSMTNLFIWNCVQLLFCEIIWQHKSIYRRYFGTKVAFYFAWLGYYTRSLMLPAVMGLLTVLFGMLHMDKDETRSHGLRATALTAYDVTSFAARYVPLYSEVSYLFDNWVTVIFAALVCVWATIFLEGWKRYHAEIAWKWGLLDFVVEEDILRPEFLRVKTKQYNPVTEQEEPYLSRNKKFANICAGGVTVVFFVSLNLNLETYGITAMDNPQIDSIAFLIVSSTAALINLIVIMIMNYFYSHLAHWLTRWECPRTQTDFDNSYTFKVFLFQFANYYSFVFYGCNPAGCFVELVIQLAIIMCGRQFFSGLVEFAYS